jgi:anti-sigma B factor antagonist
MPSDTAGDPSSLLDISTTRQDDRVVVIVRGEIDAASCDQLATALASSIDDGPLDIDVSGVGFIDSSGLRTLVQIDQQLGDRRRIRLIGPDPTFRRLLEITGLNELFDIAE